MLFLFLSIISHLPLSVNRFFGWVIGNIMYFLGGDFVSTTKSNIALSFPNLNTDEVLKLSKLSIISDTTSFFELGNCLVPDWLSSNSLIKQNYLTALLSSTNNQKLFIIPHLGCWELAARACSQYSTPIVLYKRMKNQNHEELILKLRSNGGLDMAAGDSSGIKKILKGAVAGKNIVMLPDQYPSSSGHVYSDFFIPNVKTGTLAGKLVKKIKNLDVFIVTCTRLKSGFEVDYSPISFDDDGSIQSITDNINSAIQSAIEKNPEQYLWSHKRFKDDITY